MKQKLQFNTSTSSFDKFCQIMLVTLFMVCQISWSSPTGSPSHNKHIPLPASPTIEFTSIPAYGSSENLTGRVRNVDPNNHKVAVYIFIEGSGWWTKPTFAQPLTSIQSDSTWTCDITTGGNDVYATQIHAFLLPNGINPPQAGGLADLPASLFTTSIANVSTTRSPKALSFSGYEWWVKASAVPVGPGPNYFSDSSENVWVDSQGQLHLKVTNRNGTWYCPEFILKNSLGYGKYVFYVTGKVGQLDPSVVLGLFTWDNASEEFHREIDIEFSRWTVPTDPNAQYVLQPWDRLGNRNRWTIPTTVELSAHSFVWKPDSISFRSIKGHQSTASPDSIIYSWNYTGPNIPTQGNENARINLWLFNGQPPTDNAEVEVIISKFEYEDLSTAVGGQNGIAPAEYSLSQNYPNPFNPSTTIRFEVPKPSHVLIKIYNVLGREVRTLVDGKLGAGRFAEIWDGRTDYGETVGSGIYFVRMQTNEFISLKKLVVVR